MSSRRQEVDTVSRFERGEALRDRTVDDMRRALEAAGVEFTNGDAPGVRLSLQMQPRSSAELRTLVAKGCRGRLGCKDVKESDVVIVPLPGESRNWDARIPSLAVTPVAMDEAREVIDQLRGTFALKE